MRGDRLTGMSVPRSPRLRVVYFLLGVISLAVFAVSASLLGMVLVAGWSGGPPVWLLTLLAAASFVAGWFVFRRLGLTRRT